MPALDAETLSSLYTVLVRSRSFEETAVALARDGKIPGSWLSGIGQEGTLGAVAQLRPDDFLTYTHRGAYCFLGRGCDPARLFAELLGRSTGYCRGKGGRHIADVEHGIFGKSGSIGAHAPLAVGMAIAIQNRRGDQVVLSLFGEGTSNRGTTHTSLNAAALWKLPIVWICENNGYSGSSPAAAILANPAVAELGDAYRIPRATVDGNDVLEVFEAVRPAIERARSGNGPSLIELQTYRVRPFSEGWGNDTRDPAEIERWKQRDPIRSLGRRLLEQRVLTEEQLTGISEAARTEMADARAFAEESPLPEPDDAFEDLYA